MAAVRDHDAGGLATAVPARKQVDLRIGQRRQFVAPVRCGARLQQHRAIGCPPGDRHVADRSTGAIAHDSGDLRRAPGCRPSFVLAAARVELFLAITALLVAEAARPQVVQPGERMQSDADLGGVRQRRVDRNAPTLVAVRAAKHAGKQRIRSAAGDVEFVELLQFATVEQFDLAQDPVPAPIGAAAAARRLVDEHLHHRALACLHRDGDLRHAPGLDTHAAQRLQHAPRDQRDLHLHVTTPAVPLELHTPAGVGHLGPAREPTARRRHEHQRVGHRQREAVHRDDFERERERMPQIGFGHRLERLDYRRRLPGLARDGRRRRRDPVTRLRRYFDGVARRPDRWNITGRATAASTAARRCLRSHRTRHRAAPAGTASPATVPVGVTHDNPGSRLSRPRPTPTARDPGSAPRRSAPGA